MHSLLSTITRGISSFLWPETCVVCQSSGSLICPECIYALPKANQSLEKSIYAALSYRDPRVRKLVRILKNRRNTACARVMAMRMKETVHEFLAEEQLFGRFLEPLIVPIPLEKMCENERGFNQAALIATEFAHLLPLSTHAPHLLTRIRKTNKQALIKNPTLRRKNVQNIFSVAHQKYVQDRDIIIVDDVTTTGATLEEAIKTLREKGARTCIAVAFAH
jgi:competence protein ComFC